MSYGTKLNQNQFHFRVMLFPSLHRDTWSKVTLAARPVRLRQLLNAV